MTDPFARARFEPVVGSSFGVEGPHGPTALDLVRLEAGPGGPDYESYSLEFQGPVGLGQGIHHLQHPDLGPSELFLVPLDPRGGLGRYQAIVNRAITPDHQEV